MTYYFRQTGSDHIQGPLSLAKIRHRMPDLLDGENTEVAESKGQSLETLRFETKWIPLMRALEAEEVERSSPAFTAAIASADYEKQRGRIHFLSRAALMITVFYFVSSLVTQFLSFQKLGRSFMSASVFGILLEVAFAASVLIFFIIAVKYVALAAIDIAEKAQK